MPRSCSLLLGCVVWALCVAPAPLGARDLYVDNLLGDDLSTGETPQALEGREGPVRTIAAALKLCRGSDTIHLANNPLPYFESISISGRKLFNLDLGGLTIDGHGATLSGVFRIPQGSWRHRAGGLWELHPHRKAHYQLVRFDRAVPEFQFELLPRQLPILPPGTWAAWRGVIFYQVQPEEGSPENLPLGLAAQEVGVTIHDVPNITIRNLTLRHYRLDGVNVHDRARGIVLQNVRSLENGRAGLAVAGSSQVLATDCQFSRNRVAAVLNSEVAETRLLQCELTPGQSGSPLLVRGGRVVVGENSVYEASQRPGQIIYGTAPIPREPSGAPVPLEGSIPPVGTQTLPRSNFSGPTEKRPPVAIPEREVEATAPDDTDDSVDPAGATESPDPA